MQTGLGFRSVCGQIQLYNDLWNQSWLQIIKHMIDCLSAGFEAEEGSQGGGDECYTGG